MRIFQTPTIALVSFFLLQSAESFAIQSRSDREAIVSPRSKKFFKNDDIKQYLSLGGNYTKTESSKSYELNSRYLYQSENFIHEANLINETRYGNASGSSDDMIKKSELYDVSIASKARISKTKNYVVAYHRTIYDKLSKYERDSTTAIGVGKMFFDGKVELDSSIGFHEVSAYGHEVNIIPSIRTNFKLTDKITFNQRGFWFFDHRSSDNQLKTSLIYRLHQKVSFEIRHNFEQRRYDDKAKNRVVNQQNKSITVGLVFDLN
jgi:hypothetical protein